MGNYQIKKKIKYNNNIKYKKYESHTKMNSKIIFMFAILLAFAYANYDCTNYTCVYDDWCVNTEDVTNYPTCKTCEDHEYVCCHSDSSRYGTGIRYCYEQYA